MEYTDIIGREFGLLRVEKFVGKDTVGKQKRNRYRYECLCKCGNRKIVDRINLLNEGHTTSCGCIKRRKGSVNPSWSGHGEISGAFWSSIVAKAKERDILIAVTIEQAWARFLEQNRRCALTHWTLDMNGFKGNNERTASLDRIDNGRGYDVDNIQWVHKDVNWMKGRFTQSRFIELCKAVAERN